MDPCFAGYVATTPSSSIEASAGQPVAGQEAPYAIDGTISKYSNAGGAGTGFVVTLDAPVVLTAIRIYVPDDYPSRDPASFELYGPG